MQRLIITADDFGLSPAINAAVELAHNQGILTSASLMVNGAAFADAVRIAQKYPTLSVGLHLTLLQGKATLPPQRIPHLVDREGNFDHRPVRCGWRYFLHPSIREEILEEMRAQIEKFLATGLPLHHLNGHLHIHLHPSIFPLVLRLGEEYGIRRLRLPREEFWPAIRLDRTHLVSKSLHAITFALLTRRSAVQALARGFRFPQRVYGLLQSGHMHADYLRHLIPQLKPGIVELYFHPATFPCAEFRRWMPTYDPVGELRALLSPELRALITGGGWELISYAAL